MGGEKKKKLPAKLFCIFVAFCIQLQMRGYHLWNLQVQFQPGSAKELSM